MTDLSAAAAEAGITDRQLNFWIAQGYLHPDEPNPGSGNPRAWPPGELEVARVMGVLTDAGVLAEAAHTAARSTTGRLNHRVRVVIDSGAS